MSSYIPSISQMLNPEAHQIPFLETFKEAVTSLRGYYKGTSLVAPVANGREEEFLDHIRTKAHAQITRAMRDGISLADLRAFYKGQMDTIEKNLSDLQDTHFPAGFSTLEQQTKWVHAAMAGGDHDGLRGTIIWFLDIACLLELRVIRDDEMNGWLNIKA